MFFKKNDEKENILSVHKPDGLVIRNIKLSQKEDLSNVMMKSNGNFVYSELGDDGVHIFREIDQDGNEIRNFYWLQKCVHCSDRMQLFLDSYDRVILQHSPYHLVFLDAELNFLEEVEIGTLNDEVVMCTEFDKETDEMIVMYCEWKIVFLQLLDLEYRNIPICY